MKSIVNENATAQIKPFPKLMINDKKQIVLFSEEGVGTLITHNSPGYYTDNWYYKGFTDFTGSITLEND